MSTKCSSLIYLGHSTVSILTEEGTHIMIDPFLEGNPICPPSMKNPSSIDYIVLTHGHSDHASSALSLAKKYNATICATYELAMLMGKEGLPQTQLQPMNKGGTIDLKNGIKLSLTNAFHSSSYEASDGKTYYAGEACGAVLTLPKNRNIYHAGDTCLFNDMKLIAEKFKPNIALLPIGDRFTMGPKDAALATALINPSIVIPIHHSTFPMLSGTPEEFEAELKEHSPNTKVAALKPGESFDII